MPEIHAANIDRGGWLIEFQFVRFVKKQGLKDYDQICADISEGKFSPVYFLSGDEPFFIDRISQLIESTALDESQKDFNQIILYGRETKMVDVLGNARKFPVMSERQVVLVREAQEMMDWRSKDRVKDLAQYLENPVPSTILVFCYKYKVLPEKSPLKKPLHGAGVLLETKKIYDSQVPKYIRAMVAEEGLELTDKAVDVLFELVGNNIERLHNEIQKLKLVEDHEELIDHVMIARYIGSSNPFSILDIHAAIAHKKNEKAMSMAFTLFKGEKSEILPFISSLYRFFGRILEAHHSGQKDPNGIKNDLRVNYYQAQDLAAAVYNYPPGKILECYDYLLDADKSIKGVRESYSDSKQIIQELFSKIFL